MKISDLEPIYPPIPEDELEFIRGCIGGEPVIYMPVNVQALMSNYDYCDWQDIDRASKTIAAFYPEVLWIERPGEDMLMIDTSETGKYMAIECYEPNAISALSQMYGYPEDTAGLVRVVLDCANCDNTTDEQQELLIRAGLLDEYMRLMDEDGDDIPDIGDYLVKAIRILEDKDKTRYVAER